MCGGKKSRWRGLSALPIALIDKFPPPTPIVFWQRFEKGVKTKPMKIMES